MKPTSKGDASKTAARRAEHIRINLEEDVRSKGVTTGLERYRFTHQALPETDLDSIDTSCTFFGKPLAAPLLISSMTGGVPQAGEINRNLAQVAQSLGLAMGVGSQRAAIEKPELEAFYNVRSVAPAIPLCANLGAVQLNYSYGVDQCRRAVEMLQADALILHVNPLQEALQPEGNTNFSGLLRKIEQVCKALPVPVIVKEVGWGISEQVARKLVEAGVAGIDVAGSGGTSWSEVEKHRAPDRWRYKVASSFKSWGIPTAESILMVRRGAPNVFLLASGGLRTGIDVAKCIALGADMTGIANPLLKAAAISAKDAQELAKTVIEELRITMFCIGAENLGQLKHTPLLAKVDAPIAGGPASEVP